MVRSANMKKQLRNVNILNRILHSTSKPSCWTESCPPIDGSFQREIVCCKLHWECTTLYIKMPLLIELMFSEDITRLHINLRKANDLSGILESLLKTMQKLPKRDYPLLKSLVLDGATKFSESCIVQIEELVDLLSKVAVNLENLHNPQPAILYYETDVNSILRALMNIMAAHLEDQQQLKEEQDRRFEEIEEG